MNKTYVVLLLFMFVIPYTCMAETIESIEKALLSNKQVQEKIYIHTDNRCYFVGDTIWYKAYVLRADNLHPTNISKLLYVELITPDGYLIERQRIIIDHNTQSHGQFCLPDSIYSGYYELRAYTRWQLNFNTTLKAHEWSDYNKFFSTQFSEDFFRDYEGLYSRVFPIYEKPKESGNYSERYLLERPKRRLMKEKDGIYVQFFPESGSIVSGLNNRVAFEVLDAHGKPLQIEGCLDNGVKLKSDIDGRGLFCFLCNGTNTISANFLYLGKTYTIPLPNSTQSGAIITYNPLTERAYIKSRNVTIGGFSVMCRGQLVSFQRGMPPFIDTNQMPTGVNEIIVYDTDGKALASRYIFVNHNDIGEKIRIKGLTDADRHTNGTIKAQAFEHICLQSDMKVDATASYSVCVRDARGDEEMYDDGNILTEILLAGDLRGFVSHPAYYFESTDEEHRSRLDLLLMIQGWKKYSPTNHVRYEPEKVLSIEGTVTPASHLYMEGDLVSYIYDNCRDVGNPCFAGGTPWYFDSKPHPSRKSSFQLAIDSGDSISQSIVLLEAELNKDENFAKAVTEVSKSGRFIFYLPPFYDKAILLMSAYQRKDSSRLCLSSTSDMFKLNPFVSPYYEVKRSLFYPVWTKPYSWQQNHTPMEEAEDWNNVLSRDSLEADHILENVVVNKKRRRSLRRFDKSRPAFECDFGELLNMTIDYGLHSGAFNSIAFWSEAAYSLFGNMNNSQMPIRVSASIDGHYFIKPYASDLSSVGEPMRPATLKRLLDPRHIWKIRVFTDYDKRNGTGKETENFSVPDVYFQLLSMPNEGRRAIRRDRRIVLDGISYPEEFYHRDYSDVEPDSADFRRTLYWNPCVHPDDDGNLRIDLYNNSRESILKVSICGINSEGKIFYY